MPTLTVQLGERSYPIVVVRSPQSGLANLVRERIPGRRACVVTDHNVRHLAEGVRRELAEGGFDTHFAAIPPGEEQKCLETAATLYDFLAEARADRQTLVVAVGGGVIGDLAGFVAATFNRGLPLLMAPTTLLAMVDSSVGGKVAINHPRGKNLIGAFHQPIATWIDVNHLQGLPDREYRSGLAEVVKYGVILDPALFGFLEEHANQILGRDADALEHVVLHSCALKAGVVEQDERETTGLRAILNYGHTFAHALEAVAGYGTWLHGEAVAVGMRCAALLAGRLHGVDGEMIARQNRLLQSLGLPVALPASLPSADLLAAMQLDKKTMGGRMRFVLPRKLGEVALVDDVSPGAVLAVLEEARA